MKERVMDELEMLRARVAELEADEADLEIGIIALVCDYEQIMCNRDTELAEMEDEYGSVNSG